MPFSDTQRFDFNLGGVIAVIGMEVRQPMIIKLHPDGNPEESAYRGHKSKSSISMRQRRPSEIGGEYATQATGWYHDTPS